jgi:hypothetical protein
VKAMEKFIDYIVKRLEEAAAELEKVTAGWIKISKKEPLNNARVIFYNQHGNIEFEKIGSGYWNQEEKCITEYDMSIGLDPGYKFAFTYWMPLPEPPIENVEE